MQHVDAIGGDEFVFLRILLIGMQGQQVPAPDIRFFCHFFGKFRQIHPCLFYPDLFRQIITAQILSVHDHICKYKLRCKRHTDLIAKPERQAVSEKRRVKAVRQKDPVLAFSHAEKVLLFIQLDLIGLFILVPAGISAAPDVFHFQTVNALERVFFVRRAVPFRYKKIHGTMAAVSVLGACVHLVDFFLSAVDVQIDYRKTPGCKALLFGSFIGIGHIPRSPSGHRIRNRSDSDAGRDEKTAKKENDRLDFHNTDTHLLI